MQSECDLLPSEANQICLWNGSPRQQPVHAYFTRSVFGDSISDVLPTTFSFDSVVCRYDRLRFSVTDRFRWTTSLVALHGHCLWSSSIMRKVIDCLIRLEERDNERRSLICGCTTYVASLQDDVHTHNAGH